MAKKPRIRRGYKIVIIVLLVILALPLFFYYQYQPPANASWGLNFSPENASYLGLDPQQLFLSTLDDFHPPEVRIMAYWDELEPVRGQFDFSLIDRMLEETERRGIKVILVLGHKQPRYPECHEPSWYQGLAGQEKPVAVLTMLRAAVEHFRQFRSVRYWQVENEPFFPYGQNCPTLPKDLLAAELGAVKSLDARPTLVTDSGEKGAWLPSVWAGADAFGSTMYRQVYEGKQQKYLKYPIPPFVYRIRAGVLETFSPVRQILNVELQAEPWFISTVYDTPWPEQAKLMNPQIFAEYAAYAAQVGFAQNYFWGLEWWYWAKAQGHPEMWQAVKDFFAKQNSR